MQISAINPAYSTNVMTKRISRVQDVPEVDDVNKSRGITTISFKGGIDTHLFHQISEMAIFGQSGGGVGTVGTDFFFFPLSHEQIKDFDWVVENIPLYNQEVVYAKDLDENGKIKGIKQDGIKIRRIPTGLPDDHPFKKYEGQVFTTPIQINKTTDLVAELAKKENYNKVFILDEIGNKTMEWGLEKEVPVSMYILRKDDKTKEFLKSKKWSDEQINKIDITLTYVDQTASMPKPYADGSYSSATGTKAERDVSVRWQGKPYAKEAKATAELLPLLKDKKGFDPKFITCHDGQAMPLIQFIAEKNAAGIEYYRDKIISAYGHNLCDGYMYQLGIKDAIIALAKPGELEKIVNSNEYRQALFDGREDEFLSKLLPNEIKDGRGQINAVMFPIAYGEKGYVPMFTTVSHNYYKSLIENELVSPALYERLKALSEKGVFRGILNVLMDPLASGFTTDGLQEYYKNDCKVKTADGKEVLLPKFEAFKQEYKYDINKMREVKRHNKISLLKRLDKNLKDAQLEIKDKDGNTHWEPGAGFSAATTGGTGRKVNILGGIDSKYIKMLEEKKDVIMFVSWGRGDFQKGIDTNFEAWVKFVKKTGNKNSIFVYGGDMTNMRKENTEMVEKYLKDPLFAGRFVCLDGWAPGNSFAAAGDYAALASRFAPCELTDLESMKKGCIPIVPKVQGMDQKVFDPTDTSEKAKYVNGYKGKHEYYMPETVAFQNATKEEQDIFKKAKEKIVNELSKDYKTKLGEDIPKELLDKQLKNNQNYFDALKRLRDSIISDEMADSMERAIKDRNTDVAKKILRNHVDLDTTWEKNGWCNPDGKSTAQLVRELHYNKAYGNRNLKPGDELKLSIEQLTPFKAIKNVINKTKENIVDKQPDSKPELKPEPKNPEPKKPDNSSWWVKFKNWSKTKGGKWTLGIAGSAAVIGGLGYIGYKSGWLSPKFAEEKEHGHLSQVG